MLEVSISFSATKLEWFVVVFSLLACVCERRGKRGFNSKRIILFSDLASPFADDKLKDIVGGMKLQEFEINVMYVFVLSFFVKIQFKVYRKHSVALQQEMS